MQNKTPVDYLQINISLQMQLKIHFWDAPNLVFSVNVFSVLKTIASTVIAKLYMDFNLEMFIVSRVL